MSDLIVGDWLQNDRIFILGVQVHGSTNVSTIIVEKSGVLTSYSLVSDDEAWDGPSRIERTLFDHDHINRAIEEAEEAVVMTPREVSLVRTYFQVNDSVRSVIEEIVFLDDAETVLGRLARKNAAYPYSLVLHHETPNSEFRGHNTN